jgi:two-component system, OmpR family, phosphate regulon response regulator OmpR
MNVVEDRGVFPPHILAVDDDDKLRALLVVFLQEHGYFVSEAASVAEARVLLAAFSFDAVVLDVLMPGERGTVLSAELREGGGPPVLHLSALGEGEDRVAGLEAGAQDYLVKPFVPKELLLRLANLVVRSNAGNAREGKAYLHFGAFRFDPDVGQLTRAGVPVYLTTAEQACLKILAATPGIAVSRETLAIELQGGEGNTRSVDVQINRLRKKIEEIPSRPAYIQTIRHAGYALIAE